MSRPVLTLLARVLPAYLWPEVYMAMCHTQNIVPMSALQRELKKEKKEHLEESEEGWRRGVKSGGAGGCCCSGRC